jgi:transposase
MVRRMAEIEASIERYRREMDIADRHEPEVAAVKVPRLQEKIANLTAQMEALRIMEAALTASPDSQISLTDPDARSMSSRGTAWLAIMSRVRLIPSII